MRNRVRIIMAGLMTAALLTSTTACDEKTANDDGAQSLIAQALILAGGAGETFSSTVNALTYGSNYPGTDNGNCRFLCTKGNYNQAFKRALCLAGKTPGWGQVFYKGHYTYNSVKWDKMGTKQDHQGVCVSRHGADRYTYPRPARRLFHDGCTGYPDGNPRKMTRGPNKGWDPPNWGQVFHGACVVHDLCYKAEPAFSGKSRSYCDDQMQVYARQICYASYENKRRFLRKNDLKKCLAEAGNARFWLRLGPKAHYNAYNYKFDWRPSHVCGPGQRYDVNRKDCVSN